MTGATSRSLVALRRDIDEGREDPAEVVAEARRLAGSVGTSLNAFTEMVADPVRTEGPLAGIPLAVKDVFVDGGRAPTMGSLVHARDLSGTATVLTRLRAAGASIVGYTNLHEWGIGTTSVVTATGPVRNPWDRDRIAGGSSGGSAAAVAAGIVPAAIGTDAGGSIRIPAACCGVVGLKPTFGALPQAGDAGGASELNTVGVIARSVDDAALLFGSLAGRSLSDVDTAGLRLGEPSDFFFEDVAGSVDATVHDAISELKRTLSVVEVRMVGVERAFEVVSRSLLPFMAAIVGDDLEDRADDLQASTLKALRLGLEYRDRPRVDASAVHQAWGRAFDVCDVVVTPTLPAPAPPIDQKKVVLPSGPRSADVAQIALNAPMNVAGLPAIAIPCGDVDGLPVSLTLTGRPGAEDVLLSVGRVLERSLGMRYSGRVAPGFGS